MTTAGSSCRRAQIGRAPRPPSAEARGPARNVPAAPGRGCLGRRPARTGRQVLAGCWPPPFALDNYAGQRYRKLGLIRVLDWLEPQPGATWQDRWNASGAGRRRARGLAATLVARWLRATGRIARDNAADSSSASACCC